MVQILLDAGADTITRTRLSDEHPSCDALSMAELQGDELIMDAVRRAARRRRRLPVNDEGGPQLPPPSHRISAGWAWLGFTLIAGVHLAIGWRLLWLPI